MKIRSLITLIITASFVFTFTARAQFVFENVKYTKDNKEERYSIEITYPQIKDAGNSSEKGFNRSIKNIIDSELKSFNEYLPVEGGFPDMKYELFIDYSEYMNKDDIISILISVYTYSGGAHGGTNLISVNYDMKNNKILGLGDLLKGNYLPKISDFCINYLLKDDEFSDEEWIRNGAGPEEMNYKTFAVTKEGLKIFFQQYQVLPYAAGSPEVMVPYSQLKNNIKKGGILDEL